MKQTKLIARILKRVTTLAALTGIAILAACTGNKKTSATETADGTLYREKYRSQIHFTPAEHWMNDPNGMVYYRGEYHLFYQHYPEKSVWGPMHWGHAVSRDLVHWEHLPIALYPDSLGYIFSGSAVVDWKNTSGLGTPDNPALLAFFTYHNPEIEKAGGIDVESQALAYSLDNGRTWTKYAGNPVLKNPGIRDFRDPKVFWHEDSGQWIMSIAAQQVIHFYGSKDALNWTYLSEFGQGVGCHEGVWECPDLFPLPVQGTSETKWVLIVNINPGGPAGGSATQYFVGHFDGKNFRSNQQESRWMDYGKDNYAGVTWSDAPDNRRILIGWMNNWQYAGEKPCVKWSGACTLPREMGLVKSGNGYLLTSVPVKELDKLQGETATWDKLKVEKSFDLAKGLPFAQAPVKLTFSLKEQPGSSLADKYGICLKNKQGECMIVGYDNRNKLFYIDRTNATGETFSDKFACIHSAPYQVQPDGTEWEVVIDVSSLELFVDKGRLVMTDVFYPSEPFDKMELFTKDGVATFSNVSVTQLKSIW
ncbi:glycoside hydrolase family 32 protein [Parabacteroides pacaensis]|uniref:glycoside hydrolase family 32 protein n=1 Tax=Parabacteroides pacaensis TaxID=2086575 RepID=UPI000D111677|nr:glycoside hydrolase family 32 protein [Parabacteroides pacaensis]